ncbi:uncharacterized protein ARMOST_04660 [Armillaria ostoyae]|uniref:CCHC-type domain-containing protein n=1 Tax=Armillaria ostoyae TaxID=47428 RepID=A0A284QXZ6_ARMOS|nr:uncharacterized protein ARMOST_04660 [Armillaria ostoyae]
MPLVSNQFNTFHYDEEAFGGYTPELSMGYQGYALAPDYPIPMPDSPRRIRQHGQYHSPKTSRLYAGANDGTGGSNDIPNDPPQPSNEERLLQAKELLALKDRRLAELRLELEEQQAERDAHAKLHRLGGKGKQPDRPAPHAPNPYPAPVGEAPDEAPWLGVKPLMVKPPLPFEGKYDDIERFVGDCFTYFEVFSSYFQVPSACIVFADFWCNTDDDPEAARFRFPSWAEFTTLLSQQFHDPASEEIHERRMFDLRMGKGPALSYFQELEMEAKKANRRAVWLGVPDSYTNTIASSGQYIPITYNNWKHRICIMYEERQKKWVFNQTIRSIRNTNPQKTFATTATSNHQKAGGVTSSSPAKPTSSATPPRDATMGKWHAVKTKMFGGAGEPMDIGQMRAKGLCFRCHKHGHLSKDCPNKKDYRDICVDEYDDTDTPLKGSNDGSPARAEAKAVNPAGHRAESPSTLPLRKLGQTRAKCHTSSPHGETQPMKVLDEKSPTIVTPIDTASLPRRTDGTWDKLKYTPCEVSLQAEQAAPTQRSPITTVGVEFRLDGALENTARIPTDKDNVAGATTFSSITSQGTEPITLTGVTGNSAFAVWVQPVVPIASATEPGDTLQVRQIPKPDQKEHDEDHQARPSKTAGVANAMATKKIAVGQEAASAQAVNRGHQVSIIEVPDEDDDTAYQIWLAKERAPAIARKSNEPSSVPPTKLDPSKWFKPFEVDWTLRTVCEAQNDNAACAALFVWTH